MSASEPESRIEEMTVTVGTFEGSDNILKRETVAGQSSVLELDLPAFAKDGGRPLFFTVDATNTEGLTRTTKCHMDNYDVTRPRLTVRRRWELQSNPTAIWATLTTVDDSTISRLQYTVSIDPSGEGKRQLEWSDIPVTQAPAPTVTDSSVMRHFQNGLSGTLHYFDETATRAEGKASSTIAGLSRAACAQRCLDWGSGLECKAFDALEDGNCVLHAVVEDNLKTQINTQGKGTHFVRADSVFSFKHEYEIQSTNLVMEGDRAYYLVVRARDHLGFETIAASDPIMVDTTCPEVGLIVNATLDDLRSDRCGASPLQQCFEIGNYPNHRLVVDGPGSEALFSGIDPYKNKRYTRHSSYLRANWLGVEDMESGLEGIVFGVGTSQCLNDVVYVAFVPPCAQSCDLS